MLQGRVVGPVWATKRLAELPHGAFLDVELDTGGRLVAFDVLGSGIGEHVLIATGSVAAGRFDTHPPIDALIIGSIDDVPASSQRSVAGRGAARGRRK
jgi:ethanolamine utilization protein EutN